jgi:hypothetical protein
MLQPRCSYAEGVKVGVEALCRAAGVSMRTMYFFRAEAVRGHACNPGLLARQLTLLYDGASARAGIKADDLSNLITPTVVTLLNAAGLERRAGLGAGEQVRAGRHGPPIPGFSSSLPV